ncbi:unnamed protein product [Ixodes pacificus]
MSRKERFEVRSASVDPIPRRSSNHMKDKNSSYARTPPWPQSRFVEYQLSVEDTPSSESSHGRSKTRVILEADLSPNTSNVTTLGPLPYRAISRVLSRTKWNLDGSPNESETEPLYDEVREPDLSCPECVVEYIEQKRCRASKADPEIPRSHILSDSTGTDVLYDEDGLPVLWSTRLSAPMEKETTAYYGDVKPVYLQPVELAPRELSRDRRQGRTNSAHVMFRSRDSEYPPTLDVSGSEVSMPPSTQLQRGMTSFEKLVRDAYDRYEREYQKYLENLAAWERQQQLVRDRLGPSTPLQSAGHRHCRFGTCHFRSSRSGLPYSQTSATVPDTSEEPMRVRVKISQRSSKSSATSVGSTKH